MWADSYIYDCMSNRAVTVSSMSASMLASNFAAPDNEHVVVCAWRRLAFGSVRCATTGGLPLPTMPLET